MLRVALESVRHTENGLRWTFELTNRDAQQPLMVAMNGEPAASEGGVQIVGSLTPPAPLRASLTDDRGGSWKLTSADVSIGFVRAGVHGNQGAETYSPTEIAKLMALRDDLGRNTDDPSDGEWLKVSTVTIGTAASIPPSEQFLRFRGNKFISGAPTAIQPTESVTVTMTFHPDGPSSAPATAYQFEAELVVGNSRRGYVLDRVAFDRVTP